MSHPVTVWVGALVTLAVLSYLIKDNPLYRFVQKAAMGAGVGIAVVINWQQVLKPYWWTPIQASWGTLGSAAGPDLSGFWWLLILIPGLMWYCQMSKKWFYLSQPVIGLFLGAAAGTAFKVQVLTMLPQMSSTLKPLNPWALDGGLPVGAAAFLSPNLWTVVNNAVFLIAFFCTLYYFCFTLRANNRFSGGVMQTARMVVMIALGAMFGNTVMTRMSFLIERIQYLFDFVLVQILHRT